MTRKRLSCFLVLVLFAVPVVWGCSAIMLKGKGYHVVGFNMNWKIVPGMVLINPRGIAKENLSWKKLVSDNSIPSGNMRWVSRYGSVTFSMLGMELPCYGVNEKGLFFVELALRGTGVISGPSQVRMFWAQWIQYQLDCYDSVEEVLAHLAQAPLIDWWPNLYGSHFYVADRTGNTAALELIEGEWRVSTGKKMPIPVLCNTAYASDYADVCRYADFGGTEVYTPPLKGIAPWNMRFISAAHQLRSYDSGQKEATLYAWDILNSIRRGEWQLVYDVRHGRLEFRSEAGLEIKTLDLRKLDFSAGSSARCFDVLSPAQGDVQALLKPLTPKINRDFVAKGFPIAYPDSVFVRSEDFSRLQINLDRYISERYAR